MPPKKKEDMTPEEYEALKVKLADMRRLSVAKAQERREAVERAKAEALAQHKPKRYVPVAVRKTEDSKQTVTPPLTNSQPVVVPVPQVTPPVVPITPPQDIAIIKPTPEPINMPITTPEPKRMKSPPRVPAEETFDLEKYFEAKYKAKSKYYPKKELPPPEPKPVAPTTQQLLQQNASQQIRQRVNEDLLKMAMRNVFGDY